MGGSHVLLSQLPCKADLIQGNEQGAEGAAKAVHAGGHQGGADTVLP